MNTPSAAIFQAIFTGSRVYGKPMKGSDLDIVVLVTTAQRLLLEKLRDRTPDPKLGSESPAYLGSEQYRFGKINLICCTDPVIFGIWTKGTQHCRKVGPVTRKKAIEIFEKIRNNPRKAIK